MIVACSFVFLPFIPFTSTVSSAFMCFWAFRSNSETIFGRLLVIEKKKSPSNNLAWKVVRMTWSSTSSTSSSSLLNRVMYCLNDSPFAYWKLRRWLGGFLRLCPPMKWQTKPLLSCSKFAIVPGGILLNHTLAAHFSVIGNAQHITSSRIIYNNINALNDSIWSKGSLEPSYDSNCGRRNFGGRGRFSTLVVHGEFVLLIIPSKFSPPLSLMELLNSSISFLMLWNSFSILEESSPTVLSRLLAWEFDSSSFWFPPFRRRSAFWDFIVFRSSSFWRVSSSTLMQITLWRTKSFYCFPFPIWIRIYLL